jgi:hypothetical protein
VTFSALALRRILHSKQAWLFTLLLTLLAIGCAWTQRHHGAAHGADRALETYGGIVVPLLAFVLVGSALAGAGLAGSGRPVVRLGASPARVALATVLTSMVVSALVCGAVGAAVVAVAHGAGDPPLARDVLQTLGFGALAGAAYAAYFLLGGAFAVGWWARALLLLIDWILGSDDGFGALLTARGNLGNLLGGEAPFEAAPWESIAALVVIALVCATVAVRRSARSA